MTFINVSSRITYERRPIRCQFPRIFQLQADIVLRKWHLARALSRRKGFTARSLRNRNQVFGRHSSSYRVDLGQRQTSIRLLAKPQKGSAAHASFSWSLTHDGIVI